MSRSGYSEDWGSGSEWELICWRGAVTSAMRGKRGQAFLRELVAALDALPEKKLIKDEFETAEGEVCALGAVGKARGIDMSKLELCRESASGAFGIAEALAAEIMFENDDQFRWQDRTPEARWLHVRNWAAGQIIEGDPVTKPESK